LPSPRTGGGLSIRLPSSISMLVTPLMGVTAVLGEGKRVLREKSVTQFKKDNSKNYHKKRKLINNENLYFTRIIHLLQVQTPKFWLQEKYCTISHIKLDN
jgi:hypothetical protein